MFFPIIADSTDALSSYQESHEYNEQYQQHHYDPNQYYDPYHQQQQQQYEVDGGQHQYEQLPQENNQQVSFISKNACNVKRGLKVNVGVILIDIF